jgi:nitronate monooxygenase
MGSSSTDALLGRLGVRHPIIQGPMAGGITPPAMIAAVCNAGALGSLGAAYLSPGEIRAAVAEIRRLTDRPFNVNLFTGGRQEPEGMDPAPMLGVLARYHAALGLPAPQLPSADTDPVPAQLEAILDLGVPVFSFTFGIPGADALAEMRRRGVVVLGTATTVEEARMLEDAGVDAVVAQGSEAGGHRGTFAGPFEAAMVGTMALVPQVADAVAVPVVASGGIMDGRGIVAARALGAAAVQMGTTFLGADEATLPQAFRRALAAARDDGTAVTRAFSGRHARGIVNGFMRDTEGAGISPLPFPVQNTLTRPMRSAAARQNNADALSLWAGQAARLVRPGPAAEIVRRLVRECAEVARELSETG